jgi:predicted HicB family RNase H-like nuclease
MKVSDRYLKVVEWSEEDQCYIGTSPGLMFGGVHGDSEEKVYRELREVINEWVSIHEKDGMELPPETINKVYSGKFVIRVDSELHKALTIRAMQEGKSLNRYCKKVLMETI